MDVRFLAVASLEKLISSITSPKLRRVILSSERLAKGWGGVDRVLSELVTKQGLYHQVKVIVKVNTKLYTQDCCEAFGVFLPTFREVGQVVLVGEIEKEEVVIHDSSMAQ